MKISFVFAAALCFALPGSAATIYQVNINTSSIAGTAGNLDFQFAPGTPLPPSTTVTVSNLVAQGAALGSPMVTGDVSGSLSSTLILRNTPVFPPSDYYTPIQFGSSLSFRFGFSGPGITAPDPTSGGSTFAFSLLDNANPPNPLLLVPNWPQVDPGGFAFIANVNGDGTVSIQNFLAAGTITQATQGVPEPNFAAGVGFLLLTLAGGRHLRNIMKTGDSGEFVPIVSDQGCSMGEGGGRNQSVQGAVQVSAAFRGVSG